MLPRGVHRPFADTSEYGSPRGKDQKLTGLLERLERRAERLDCGRTPTPILRPSIHFGKISASRSELESTFEPHGGHFDGSPRWQTPLILEEEVEVRLQDQKTRDRFGIFPLRS
jgi:hypothetical protein